MKEKETVLMALENLEKALKIKGKWRETAPPDLDGQLDLIIDNHPYKLLVEVKTELRNHQIPQLQELAKKYREFMVIAERIFPKIKQELRNENIAYLEGNGNIWLNKKGKTILWIDTNEPLHRDKEKINRAFTKTGLKVIFYFLQNEEWINLTYRELADKIGVALGNINYILNGLKETGYLLKADKNNYKLTNKKELLQKWMTAYAERLKPTLEIGTFRFLKGEDFENWKGIQLKTDKTRWGGEAAGALLTNYLLPEILTIYTDEERNDLIKHYRLIPDPQGNVKVYRKFWRYDEVNDNFAPPLLVYADLMNTGDRRCIETAEKIYNELLRNRFQ